MTHTHSPRSRDNQRAQVHEFRRRALLALVDHISETPRLRDEIVLQGGATLYFVYGSGRLSGDLDFVSRKPGFDEIARLLEGLDIEPDIGMHVTVARKAVPESCVRVAYGVKLGPGLEPVFNVEGYYAPPLLPTQRYSTRHGFVEVESPAEILADKLVACLNRLRTRASIKPTDLHDITVIEGLFSIGEVSLDLLVRKEAYYDFTTNIDGVRDQLNVLKGHIETNFARLVETLRAQLDTTYVETLDFEKMKAGVERVINALLG